MRQQGSSVEPTANWLSRPARLRALLLTTALAMCLSSGARAQSTWTGPGGNGNTGLWGVPTNWTPNGVPNAVDAEVIINQIPGAGAVIDLFGGTFTIGTMRVNTPTSYLIGTSSAPGTLNFEVSAGNALIEISQVGAPNPLFVATVNGGSALTVNLVSSTEANVAAGQTLWFGDLTTLSGAGQLILNGAGTVRIDGASTRTGQTLINAGTLEIRNTGALGSGDVRFTAGTLIANVSGTLNNGIVVDAGGASHIVAANGQTLTLSGGTFTVNAGGAAIRFGQTGGTGVVVWDSGPLVLNGVPLYTIDVLGGTLRSIDSSFSFFAQFATATNVAAGATLEVLAPGTNSVVNLSSAGSIVIGAGASLSVDGGGASGAITGSGALIVNGVVTLTGTNTYTGGTTIQAGALLGVGAGGTTGSIVGNVANNGTLVLFRGDTYQFDGMISGTGALQHAGTGTLILTGTNTYTGTTAIGIGILQLGNGGTTGSIVGNVLNQGTLAFNRADTYQYDGVISSTGAVQQIGTGTIILTANHTYTGATTISAGTLLVNGSIASSSGLTVGVGGTIGGVGTLPSSVVSGTLAPGNSIGTINVAGNLTFAGTGVYLVEVGSAAADRTNVAGTASLAGTARFVSIGQPLAFGTRYTILNAAGGVSGTFTSVDNQLGGAVRPTLSYDANNVFLTLDALALAPTLSGLTQNQQAVVSGLDRGIAAGGNANPFLPLFLLPASSVPAALDQLSGQVHTGTQGLGILVSGQFLQVMLDPFALGRTPGTNPALAYAGDALAGLPGVVAATQAADLPAQLEVFDTRRFAVWAAAFGSDGRIGGDAGIGSVRRSERSTGIAAGVDFRVAPGTLFGFALAGGGADASLSGGLGSVSADVFQAGLYGMTRFGFLDLRAALAYSRLEVDTARSIPALGIAQVNGSYDAEVWSGRIEAAVPLTFAGLSVAPVAALQVQSVRTDGFTESVPGGLDAAALTVDGRTSTTTRGELGARFETRFGMPGFEATAFARLAWAHYFERDSSVSAAFIGLPGSNFTVIGARPDRDSALVSTGLDVRITPQLSIGARFDGEFSENVSQYAGTARIRFEF